MGESKQPQPVIDKRDAFAVQRRGASGDPDLVITIRQPDPRARWRRRPRVIMANGGHRDPQR